MRINGNAIMKLSGTAFVVTSVLLALNGCCLAQRDDDMARRKIKVACIGDSITWGHVMTNRVEECYPAQLQRILGDGYEVANFGAPGAGAYHHTPKNQSYRRRLEYPKALDYDADIVVSNFGINDWETYAGEYEMEKPGRFKVAPGTFRRDYTELLESFVRGGKRPCFIVWNRLAPRGTRRSSYKSPWPFVMEHDLDAVAAKMSAAKLDMYEPLLPYADTPHYCADGLHPEGVAQAVIAQRTASVIRTLKMPIASGER